MRLEGAIVDVENGILHIRIPFLRVVERKDIRLDALPVHHTKRETEVLRCLAELKANKEIAHALNLSERTVKFHVSSLLRKHKVMSRMQLIDQLRNEEDEVSECK